MIIPAAPGLHPPAANTNTNMNVNMNLTHAFALVVALTGATGANAFERARSEMGAPMRWPKDAPIPYALIGAWSDDERAAIERAIATWNATKCVKLAPSADAKLTITRGALDAANATLAAQTKLETTKPRQGVIEGARITLDEKRTFTSVAASIGVGQASRLPSSSSESFDLETVILHELGHALGLAHPKHFGVKASVVMRAGIKAGEVKRSLDDDDVNGACK